MRRASWSRSIDATQKWSARVHKLFSISECIWRLLCLFLQLKDAWKWLAFFPARLVENNQQEILTYISYVISISRGMKTAIYIYETVHSSQYTTRSAAITFTCIPVVMFGWGECLWKTITLSYQSAGKPTSLHICTHTCSNKLDFLSYSRLCQADIHRSWIMLQSRDH